MSGLTTRYQLVTLQGPSPAVVVGLLCGLLSLQGCNASSDGTPTQQSAGGESVTPVLSPEGGSTTPEEFQLGESRFNALCARCHGMQGKGTPNGPPLVHKIYEPSHHSDMAFIRAASQGVRAHHWKFGNMPKIDEATVDDVKEVIKYVRWLQRQAGIQ